MRGANDSMTPGADAAPVRWWPRLLALAIAAVAAGALAYLLRDELSLDELAAREQQLRRLYREHPLPVLAAALALYVVVAGLSIPGALPLSLTYGWLFGFLPAAILVSFASTAGATISFLLSRYLIGDWVQARFGERLSWFNDAVDREGAWFLLSLRLVPLAPFWLVNLLAGLTKLRVTTFWWVSQVGMLPGTLVFLWVGASAPTLEQIADQGAASLVSVQTIGALTAVGLLPLAARWVVSRLRGRESAASQV